MDKNYKVIAFVLCGLFFAICVWLSLSVMRAPSNSLDRGIAMVCDYARPQDVRELETLSRNIKSPWWREYAKSRLCERMEGTPEAVCARIFGEFRHGEIRAYVLAVQALHVRGLDSFFQKLPPRDAEFAYLIYAIRKGMLIDADVFQSFKETFLAGSSQRMRSHYAEVLLDQAFKMKNPAVADLILSSMDSPKDMWGWLFVSAGYDVGGFVSLSNWEKRVLEPISESKAAAPENFDILAAKYLKRLKGFRGGIFERRNLADALWNVDAPDDSLAELREVYGMGKWAGTLGWRSNALKSIAQSIGSKGRPDLAPEFVFASAGNSEILLGFVSEASVAAARTGHMDEAVSLLRAFDSLAGRVQVTFHPPTFPEDRIPSNR